MIARSKNDRKKEQKTCIFSNFSMKCPKKRPREFDLCLVMKLPMRNLSKIETGCSVPVPCHDLFPKYFENNEIQESESLFEFKSERYVFFMLPC